MKKSMLVLLILVMVFGVVRMGNADPFQWKIEDGGNGHWYEAIAFVSSWEEANEEAQTYAYYGITGHLATLTSAEENAFVWETVGVDSYWLGGYQTDKLDEPDGHWAWVTDEEWVYTNWAPYEPNDGGGDEQHLQFKPQSDGKWNDNNALIGSSLKEPGFIIEYPVPELLYYELKGECWGGGWSIDVLFGSESTSFDCDDRIRETIILPAGPVELIAYRSDGMECGSYFSNAKLKSLNFKCEDDEKVKASFEIKLKDNRDSDE